MSGTQAPGGGTGAAVGSADAHAWIDQVLSAGGSLCAGPSQVRRMVAPGEQLMWVPCPPSSGAVPRVHLHGQAPVTADVPANWVLIVVPAGTAGSGGQYAHSLERVLAALAAGAQDDAASSCVRQWVKDVVGAGGSMFTGPLRVTLTVNADQQVVWIS